MHRECGLSTLNNTNLFWTILKTSSKMIFASDLDQTLIYSKNFMAKHGDNQIGDNLSIIEYYQGLPLSYIHKDVITILKKMDLNGCFVPVTTRTEEQFKRIDFSRFGINPRYAVTTNGAKVLKNGAVDEQWQKHIQFKLSQINLNADAIADIIKDMLSPEVVKKIRVAEGVFSYCVLNRDLLNLQQVEVIREKLGPEGWEISLQGTKLYFMPGVISKWDAMEYVCTQLGVERVISAGDSLLDLPLLRQAEIGLVPGHGEIFNQKLHETYDLKFCGTGGVEASIAIAGEALKKVDS
ncbi:haloacid dehalogenase [Marinilabiliaceae bacterium JC017]|nr:haloacid dehalogenase [Marinilabiliaceae bacterium JC017]